MRSSMLAFMGFLLSGLALVTPALAVDTPDSRAQEQVTREATPRPMIVLQGDRLSVRIRNVPWDTVAQEIERHTGIAVRIEGPLAGTLTQEFEAIPLEEGMRRLFRNTNYIFFYAASPGPLAQRLVRVWMLPEAGSTTRDTPGSAPVGGVALGQRENLGPMGGETEEEGSSADEESVPARGDLEERLTALSTLADGDNREALQQAVFDADQILQLAALGLLAARAPQEAVTFLLGTSQSQQPEARVQALTLLHQTSYADERTIVAALAEALADEDAGVRGYAIQALGERGGSEALRPLRDALHDPDPAVRMMVIAYVRPTEQSVGLLQEALSDDDETLRSAAAAKLADIASAGQ